ncbi:MAG: FecR domain-containing protein [Gammaproteobacteria bacterium]|nr:FecR domain-containing protein [Gammaproteobacteria bacterium]
MSHTRESRDDLRPGSMASRWFVRRRVALDGNAGERLYQRWIDTDPRNREDYAGCERVWQLAGALEDDPRYRALFDSVAAHLRVRRHRARGWLLAAAVALLAVGLFVSWRLPGPQIYATGNDEQRVVTLADASSVTLETDTSVIVRYSSERRRLDLARGVAAFDVTPDRDRPFEVAAGAGMVRALGTRFDVALHDGRVQVAVSEGTVSVETRTQAGEVVSVSMLGAGETLAYRADGSVDDVPDAGAGRRDTQVAGARDGREGKLDFDADRLADVLAEFNRHARTKLVVGSSGLADLRVSGVFRVGDTDALVYALEQVFAIRAIRKDDVIVLVRERGARVAAGIDDPAAARPR